MPAEGVRLIEHRQILRYEEIVRVVEAAAELGVTRIRLTGGEPLVRKGIETLVKGIAAVPGITDLSMTTNGVLLAGMARALKEAGLKRVNISLDSLVTGTYRRITRCGNLPDVLAGIKAALDCGLDPVKVNVVLMKGVNDLEIDSFFRLAIEYPISIRFIEYMPIDYHDGGWTEKYLPLQAVLNRAADLGYPLEPADSSDCCGPAEMYRIPGALGLVGLIHPISGHFCSRCNRLRLTADGYLKPCLYWEEEFYVRPVLGDKAALKKLFGDALERKKEKHGMSARGCGQKSKETPQRGMSMIGG
jgi:cyclic pyranopterin phosphate synthase